MPLHTGIVRLALAITGMLIALVSLPPHEYADFISIYTSIFLRLSLGHPKVFRQYSLLDVFQPSCRALYLVHMNL
jgi:hypothetical protein